MNNEVMQALAGLADDLARIEAKVDALMTLRDRRQVLPKAINQMSPHEGRLILRELTAKQHAVGQMLVLGMREIDMAERLGVSRNTIKLHVAAIYRKLHAHSRDAAAAKLAAAMDAVDANEYRSLAYGLPKGWAVTWTPDDPYQHLVGHKKGGVPD